MRFQIVRIFKRNGEKKTEVGNWHFVGEALRLAELLSLLQKKDVLKYSLVLRFGK